MAAPIWYYADLQFGRQWIAALRRDDIVVDDTVGNDHVLVGRCEARFPIATKRLNDDWADPWERLVCCGVSNRALRLRIEIILVACGVRRSELTVPPWTGDLYRCPMGSIGEWISRVESAGDVIELSERRRDGGSLGWPEGFVNTHDARRVLIWTGPAVDPDLGNEMEFIGIHSRLFGKRTDDEAVARLGAYLNNARRIEIQPMPPSMISLQNLRHQEVGSLHHAGLPTYYTSTVGQWDGTCTCTAYPFPPATSDDPAYLALCENKSAGKHRIDVSNDGSTISLIATASTGAQIFVRLPASEPGVWGTRSATTDTQMGYAVPHA